MDVQKDWEEVITKPDEKFWILQKRTDGPTIFGSLSSPLSNLKQTDDDQFIIKNWNEKSLVVECTVTNTIASFIAPLKTLPLSQNNTPLLSMDVSPSGELGVSSSINGGLWVWETDTGINRRLLEGHIGDVESCRFFPSGLVVLSGGSDFRVKIWSVQDGTCPRTLTGHTRGITGTCIVEKGRNIITCSMDGSIRLWSCGSSKCLSVLCNASSPISGCGLISDSSLASPPQGNPIDEEYGTESKVLWSVSHDSHMRLFDIRNKTMVNKYIHNDTVPLTSGVALQDSVICGTDNGEVIVLDLRQLKEPLKTQRFVQSSVSSLCCYNDKVIVGHRNGACIVWNCHNDVLSQRLTGSDIDPVSSIVRRGHVTYTSSRDGRVRIYDHS